MSETIPLVLLTGFLASGKSTLLDAVLHDLQSSSSAATRSGPRVCVILNEFAEHGIGIRNELAHCDAAAARVELFESGGCICCTGRDAFADTLRQLLAHRDRLDVVVVEANGLADPPAFLSILFSDATLAAFRLAAVVCMVDTNTIGDALDRPRGADTGSGLIVVNEQVEQLLVADTVVLNKVDVASKDEVERVAAKIALLNPRAAVVRATRGRTNTGALAVDMAALMRGTVTLSTLQATDPNFLEFRPFRSHGLDVGAVSFEFEPVERRAFEDWLNTIVATNGDRLLRYKAVVALPGDKQQLVVQGFRKTFELRVVPKPQSAHAADDNVGGVVSLIGLQLDAQQIVLEFGAVTGVKCVLMSAGATPRPPLSVMALRLAVVAAVIAAVAAPDQCAALLDAVVPGASAAILQHQWAVVIAVMVVWFALQAALQAR